MFDPPGSVALVFQPLVSLSARRIIGFTAHSLRPGDDILRTACRVAARWPDGMRLGIEFSPARWHDPAAGLRVLSVLGETGLPPARLELDIAANVLAASGRVMCRAVEELRWAGVMIALTGCGPQTEDTAPFCFDTLKLAASVVARLGRDDGSASTLDRIVALAAEQGVVTAADGISSQAQLAILDTQGCVEGQGALFGQSMPAASIPALLRYPGLAEAVA